jgi:hypothetical protein
MVTKSPVVVQPGGVPARAKVKPAATGLARINEVLDVEVVQAIADAGNFSYQFHEQSAIHTDLGRAKVLHGMWLPNIARAVEAHDVLSSITFFTGSPLSRLKLTTADASTMLHYLYGAMGKRRNDEAAAKLLACTDIFSPASNALGSALGFWEEAPTHPVILAVAIKQLMAAKTFEPAEAELREALLNVKERLSAKNWWVWKWLEKLDQMDTWIFKDDRLAWDAAYANVRSKIPLCMQKHAELGSEGPGEDLDENGNPEYPPSPRWQALNDLYETKRKAEQLAAPPKRKRIAAAKKRGESKRSTIKVAEEAR